MYLPAVGLCGKLSFSSVTEYENSRRGFNRLIKWVRKHAAALPKACFVMEATGIYYEMLAYHVQGLKLPVCVVLPNKVKHYAKSLNIKSKTDIIDARMIAQMGAERNLQEWSPPKEVFKNLRALTRLYSDLKGQHTSFVNRLHTMESGHDPLPFIIKSAKELIRKGYDVVQRESGSSIKGKTRISKKGNSRIRAALDFPALAASPHNKDLQAVYHRINEQKPSKMVGATALQRKLLILIYPLWKNDTTYQSKTATSRDQETKPPLRHNDEVVANEAGKPISLPAQDELPSDLSTEALLRHQQSS